MSGSAVQENRRPARWGIFPLPCGLGALALIGIKTMMTIIPEKSAYCCRWARKLGESFYVINCSSCFRNTASNFSGLAEQPVDKACPLLARSSPSAPCLCCGGGGAGQCYLFVLNLD